MKLYLPNKEVVLDTKISFGERNELIQELLKMKIVFQDQTLSVEEYFRETWNRAPTKVSMDVIGYYLTKGNADGEDREVMSNGKVREMERGSRRHTTFTSMSREDRVSLGVTDADDLNYN